MKRVLALVLALSAPLIGASRFPADDQTITHVLNRVAFGPRPEDIARIRATGVERYIEDQLRPDRLDDAAMSARLAGLTTVRLPSREIAARFERPVMEARRENKEANGSPSPARRALQQQANSVVVELAEQKILRAVYSERQVQEVLADFWFNHFNVDARKGPDRFLLTEYEREAIRPHVLGKFRDLLGATAKSPAMLFYLDNWMSTGDEAPYMPAGLGRRLTRSASTAATRRRTSRRLRARLPDGRSTTRDRAARTGSRRGCTIRTKKSCWGTSSKRAAANRMANRCSTFWRGTRRRRGSSRRSSLDGS
jgi:uncharacterized protein DUF1800